VFVIRENYSQLINLKSVLRLNYDCFRIFAYLIHLVIILSWRFLVAMSIENAYAQDACFLIALFSVKIYELIALSCQLISAFTSQRKDNRFSSFSRLHRNIFLFSFPLHEYQYYGL